MPESVAVIIGAGDATGGAIARRFAREGYTVCVTRRNEEALAPLVQEIEQAGGKARPFGCDARDEEQKLELVGPHTELAPNDALSLGLAIHELATNAAKYGSLSVPGGCVTVRWSQMNETLAKIEWVESGGPSVSKPMRRGFGTDLIEKIVAHELKHPVDLRCESKGVRCVLRVPIRRPTEFRMRARRSQLREGPPRS